ncbi:MAG: site-specific integrase [Armatimonadota bacterium]
MPDITLHDAATEYLEHLKSEGKSPRTIYTYHKDIDQIEAYFGPDKKLQSILIPHVSKFLKSDALLKMPGDKERSEPTVKKTVRVFRMFLVWALGKEYIAKLPLPKDISMGHSVMQTTEVLDASSDSTD